jgi:alpha-1,2-mannosyltransferase
VTDGTRAGLRRYPGRAPLLARPATRTLVQVLIVLALAGAAWAFVSEFAVRHGFFDLKVYYGAINYWAHGRGEIYDYLQRLSKYGFTYPPFAAVAMLPMAVLSWQVTITGHVVATTAATLALLYWFLGPVARRYGWPVWFTVAVGGCLVAVFEPLRETMAFGQVNMMLVVLVVGDLLLLVGRRSPAGGIGIGLATAVKLTPGVFILYLLLARRFRAAFVASSTALAATVLAALVSPAASREFWTDALWDTDRIGTLSFISNQSLEGFVARLHPGDPSTSLWLALVLVVLAVWVVRTRRAVRAGDDRAGLALTGVLGCLISPVTWIHHLVWLLPALLLLVDRGLAADRRRRVALLGLAAGLYALLSSRVVWLFAFHFAGWGWLGSNLYLLASLVLLAALPIVAGPGAEPGGAKQPAAGSDGTEPAAVEADGAEAGGAPPRRARVVSSGP